MFLVAYGKKSLGEIFNKNMAYGQKSIIESSEFRLQTSDLRLQTSFLRYSYSITVSKKQKQGLHLTFWRNRAVWYYRMMFLPAATQPR